MLSPSIPGDDFIFTVLEESNCYQPIYFLSARGMCICIHMDAFLLPSHFTEGVVLILAPLASQGPHSIIWTPVTPSLLSPFIPHSGLLSPSLYSHYSWKQWKTILEKSQFVYWLHHVTFHLLFRSWPSGFSSTPCLHWKMFPTKLLVVFELLNPVVHFWSLFYLTFLSRCWISSVCSSKSPILPLHPPLYAEKLNCPSWFNSLLCPLAASWVWPTGSPSVKDQD